MLLNSTCNEAMLSFIILHACDFIAVKLPIITSKRAAANSEKGEMMAERARNTSS